MRRAFTLVEALIGIGLFLITLSLFVGALQGFARQRQQNDTVGARQELLRIALDQLRADIASATVWTRPLLGTTAAADTLEVERPNLDDLRSRYPWPLPTPFPASFDPGRPRAVIRISRVDQQLIRHLETAAGFQDDVLAERVTAFSVRHPSDRLTEIQIDADTGRAVASACHLASP